VARTVIVIFAFSILFAYLINPIVRFPAATLSLFQKPARPARLGSLSRFDHLHRAFSRTVSFLNFRKSADQLLASIPTLTDRVSSGEIANNLGNNLGWADEKADQIRIFLSVIARMSSALRRQSKQSAPAALAGFVVIPVLAIFFLSDGENLANQVIHLVSAKEKSRSPAISGEPIARDAAALHPGKSNPGGLSLLYCLIAMLLWVFQTR